MRVCTHTASQSVSKDLWILGNKFKGAAGNRREVLFVHLFCLQGLPLCVLASSCMAMLPCDSLAESQHRYTKKCGCHSVKQLCKLAFSVAYYKDLLRMLLNKR